MVTLARFPIYSAALLCISFQVTNTAAAQEDQEDVVESPDQVRRRTRPDVGLYLFKRGPRWTGAIKVPVQDRKDRTLSRVPVQDRTVAYVRPFTP